MSEPFGCGKCDQRWGGINTAHCGGCHKTFSGIHAFDKHRTGSHSKGRHCLDPATVVNEVEDSPHFGEKLFKLTKRSYPCWTTAGDPAEWWKE